MTVLRELLKHDGSLLNHTTYLVQRDQILLIWNDFGTHPGTIWYFDSIKTGMKEKEHKQVKIGIKKQTYNNHIS